MLLGDKEEKDKYKMYNEGYVPDLVRPGASAWGTDWIGESKVASPLTKAGPGVGCQDVGVAPDHNSTHHTSRPTNPPNQPTTPLATRRRASAAPCWAAASAARLARRTTTPRAGAS